MLLRNITKALKSVTVFLNHSTDLRIKLYLKNKPYFKSIELTGFLTEKLNIFN